MMIGDSSDSVTLQTAGESIDSSIRHQGVSFDSNVEYYVGLFMASNIKDDIENVSDRPRHRNITIPLPPRLRTTERRGPWRFASFWGKRKPFQLWNRQFHYKYIQFQTRWF